ncbi:UvrD-helicase domain-containing protein, partial [Bacteroidota bacterium]
YKASAGSGKTYTLARDFISLVITDPELYRHVLAVTFTNKATDEMKNRILDELYKLSRGESSPMMDFIATENGLSSDEVSGRAEIILETILHNYSRFHIETIDRFFQRAIRAFTREIGLSGGYQIELDSEKVLSETIDEMFMGLDQEPGLLEWFVEFARDKVQEGKHWNLKKDLLVLGQELSKERFQEGSEELVRQLRDKEEFSSFQKELLQIKYSFENSLKSFAKEAIGIMEGTGLRIGDFKGQYGVGVFFDRLLRDDFKPPSATILKAVDEPAEWFTKDSPQSDQIISVYESGMNDLLKNCVYVYDRQYTEYRSAEAVRNFLYTLGILTDISTRMNNYAETQGIFLLSNAARFLNGIIGENDAPFIYEKIGNYFHHFMIDEFQDTSGLQWKNFRPLIENSLANNYQCLVVGDVKQSIYRWRNSDWEILSEQLQMDFSEEQIEQKGLKHNWRSLENIIRFNNGFFESAREILRDHFKGEGEVENGFAGKSERAYMDVNQEIPGKGKEGGYVRVSLISESEEGNWKDVVDQNVISTIEEFQDRGIDPSETAILVRSKRDGKRIADAILEYKSLHPGKDYIYDVISNESLYLYNAISVRILIGALRFLVSPEDRVNLAQLLFEYKLFTEGSEDTVSRINEVLGNTRSGQKPDLPGGFLDESLRYLTLTELTERIIDLFSLGQQPSQTPYILGFQDLVLNYCRGGAADINSFLDWWDDNGQEKSLTISEDQNAIQVMTIHKAKGLEFRAVIIPYCNWSFDHRSPNPEILWCSSTREPFSKLSLLPVRYASSLAETIFSQDYREENFRIYMDHLNLLYVAFTRARENMVVFAPEGKAERFSDVSVLLKRILKDSDSIQGGSWDDNDATWTLGNLISRSGEKEKSDQIIIRTISSHEFSGKLRLLYRGLDFFDPGAEKRVHYGTLMHEIFSRIHTAADIGRALDSVRRDGLIDSTEADKLKPGIKGMVETENVREWFDGSWRVIAEQDILTRDGSIRRPDRVMIKKGRVVVVDYKFGQKKSPGHLTQVRKYANMLRQMEYTDVSGFIWYVNQNEVVQV